MFNDTEDWCKIWRETDLYFQKWHEEFRKCTFKNGMKNFENFHRLKNSILAK